MTNDDTLTTDDDGTEPVEWDDRWTWVPAEEFPVWFHNGKVTECEACGDRATRILDAREAGWFTYCDLHPRDAPPTE